MDETIHDFLILAAKFVGTGIPLVLVLISSAVLIFARSSTCAARKALQALRITGMFCAMVWLFYYAEIWSPRRIPVFDYGAPLLAVSALIVLPIFLFLIWSQRRILFKSAGLKGLFVLGNVLIGFSMTPGLFIVAFCSAVMMSNK